MNDTRYTTLDSPIGELLLVGDGRALEGLYMQAARESIVYFRLVSHTAYGRDIPYVLLLHISPFEARMLPRLLDLYRQEGFRFVSLPNAEGDPVYAEQVQPQLPADPMDMEGKAASKIPLPKRTDFAPQLAAMCLAAGPMSPNP